MTPPRLLLLLTLGLGAAGRDPHGLPAPLSTPEAPPASSGSWPGPRGEPRVGSAGGRAQCPAGPCGKPGQDSPAALLRALELPGRGGVSRGEFLRQRLGHDSHPGTHPDPHPQPHPPPDPHPQTHPPPDQHPDSHPSPDPAHALTATAIPGTSPGTPGAAPPSKGQLSTAERYVLGSVAGLALALCPLLALALLRCPLCHRAQRWLHPLLLGLAAGTLSGDAFLHLLPQLLGSHSHSGRSEAGESWAVLGVLGGLYGAFLMEKLLQMLLPSEGEAGPSCQRDVGQQLDVGQQPGGSSAELVKMEEGDPPPLSPELQSRGLLWTVALGGAAHSVGDGLALGAAFAHSWGSGAGTGLALLCHQLPHAFGTCSALSQSGLSGRWSLVLAAGWALPVLPGLYVGLALGTGGPARAWLSAATTGLLLHLALVRMVPSLVWAQDKRPWVLLGVQSIGLLGGWGLLLGLAVAEDVLAH